MGHNASASEWPQQYVFVVGILLLGMAASATQAEPKSGNGKGKVTVSRDVPVHIAYREGPKGKPFSVSTSPEDMVLSILGIDSDGAAGIANRALTEGEFARTVASLASPDSGLMTGTALIGSMMNGAVGSTLGGSAIGQATGRIGDLVTHATGVISPAIQSATVSAAQPVAAPRLPVITQ